MPIISQPEQQQGPKLGLNLFDLERVEPGLRLRATKGKLDLSGIRRGAAEEDRLLALSCPLAEAALLCDVLRSEARRAGEQLRCYLRREEGQPWQRLPADAVLTRIVGGKAELEPRWFGREHSAPTEARPIEVEVI